MKIVAFSIRFHIDIKVYLFFVFVILFWIPMTHYLVSPKKMFYLTLGIFSIPWISVSDCSALESRRFPLLIAMHPNHKNSIMFKTLDCTIVTGLQRVKCGWCFYDFQISKVAVFHNFWLTLFLTALVRYKNTSLRYFNEICLLGRSFKPIQCFTQLTLLHSCKRSGELNNS